MASNFNPVLHLFFLYNSFILIKLIWIRLLLVYKEDLRDEYNEVFKTNAEAKIQKCDFCKEYRIYPIHYKDENNQSYQREFTKDKKKFKSICCMDCNQQAEQKKEDYKFENTEYCFICKSSYIALSDSMITCHLNSIKHKKNKAAYEGKKDLSLLTVKELTKICSKSFNENEFYRINNYSKMKKDELVKQMNDVYDLLVFD
jgi:hypothetical protein